MDISKRLALAVVLVVVCASVATAEEIERDFDHRFEVGQGARLHLEHGDGDVVFSPWNEPVIAVEVRYRATVRKLGFSRAVDFEVEFRQDGDVARVIGRETGFGGVGFFHLDRREYVYRVRAPTWVALELEGDDGDVEIAGWRAAIRLESDDGDVRLRDVAAPSIELEVQDGDVVIDGLEGDLTLSSDDGEIAIRDCASERLRIAAQDGDVVLERCEGNVEITVDDGNVRLDQLRAARVAVETGDGDVVLDLLSAPGALDLELETDDGDLVVGLPAEVSARFEIRIDDGRVDLDLPAARDVERREHRTTGVLGGGEGKIEIVAGDGRVTLRSR